MSVTVTSLIQTITADVMSVRGGFLERVPH